MIPIEIHRKMNGHDGWGCFFTHKGQEYIADLTIRTDLGWITGQDFTIECIIFKAVDHQITFENALGVCYGLNCEYSADAVRRCVEDFIDNN